MDITGKKRKALGGLPTLAAKKSRSLEPTATAAAASGSSVSSASNWTLLRMRMGKPIDPGAALPASSLSATPAVTAATHAPISHKTSLKKATDAGPVVAAAVAPHVAHVAITAAASKGLAAGMSFGSFGAAASSAGGHKAGVAFSSASVSVAAPSSAVSRAVSATAASAASEIVAASAAVADDARKRAILGPFERTSLTPAEQRYVAVDCEMVGTGPDGAHSALAQVVAVDYAGRVIYCKYVRVRERVTDYRTAVSGIKPEHLTDPAYGAVDFDSAQREIAALLKGRILVGHGLTNDLKALMLGHSWREIRDTARYAPFCYRNREGKTRPRRLKHLAATHLGCVIQEGEHDPAEDARAALALFRKFRREWESSFAGGGATAGVSAGTATAAAGSGALAKAKAKGSSGKARAGGRSQSQSRDADPAPAAAAAGGAGTADAEAGGAAVASRERAPDAAPRPHKVPAARKGWKGKRMQAKAAAAAAASASASASSSDVITPDADV